jgi:hypothetical protein
MCEIFATLYEKLSHLFNPANNRESSTPRARQTTLAGQGVADELGGSSGQHSADGMVNHAELYLASQLTSVKTGPIGSTRPDFTPHVFP